VVGSVARGGVGGSGSDDDVVGARRASSLSSIEVTTVCGV